MSKIKHSNPKKLNQKCELEIFFYLRIGLKLHYNTMIFLCLPALGFQASEIEPFRPQQEMYKKQQK